MFFSRIRAHYYFHYHQSKLRCDMNSRMFVQSVQPINTTLLGKSFVLLPAILKLESYALHVHHILVVPIHNQQKKSSVSESGLAVLSNV